MRESDVWKNVSETEFDNAMEGMEKLVMNRLYDLYVLIVFVIAHILTNILFQHVLPATHPYGPTATSNDR